MKKFIIFLCAFAALSSAFAQTQPFDPLLPKSAEVMAMGGSFVSVASGYNALFANPAGLASRGSLTLASVNPWLYVRPSQSNFELLKSMIDKTSQGSSSTQELFDLMSRLIIENGFGGGMQAGVGWAGNGLGLGLYSVNDLALTGETFLGVNGVLESMTGAVFGLAFPIDIFGLKLSLGADVRPYYRMRGFVRGTDLISTLLSPTADPSTFWQTIPVTTGFGVAFDAGAILQIGPLSAGLAIRDIAPPMLYTNYLLGDAVNKYLALGDLPPSTADSVEIASSPNIIAGAAFHPNLGALSWLIDPMVSVELQDPISVFRDGEPVWNLIHVGGQLKLLSFISLRAGVNKGYMSFGGGVRLLILDVNAAVFTEEAGIFPGDKPRTGVSLEVALRL